MSNLPKDWEADIRQKVNDHEFSYDPAAWGEMSSLLDQVSLAAPNTGGNSTLATVGKIKLSSIIIVVLLALLAIAALLWYKEKNAPAPILESWSVVVPPPTPELVSPTTSQTQTVVTAPQRKRTFAAELPTPILPTNDDVQLVKEIPSIRIPQKVILPLSRSDLPDTVTSTSASPSIELPEIQLPKRKRNRKTLFPDVIENN